ncbi:glycosyltransferase [Aureimonas sp. AU12]|uniref:glycosyltransferase n=1 Tax=Aureimonas sp. AU12 TaxID=1638161 RepID=UPI000784FA2D|nr:glycosyltransferase [Aureimonas sp. AU12]
MRVLVVAHGHPMEGPGGAEVAAYNLVLGLREDAAVSAVSFLARTARADLAPGAIVEAAPGDYLWRRDMADAMRLSAGREAPGGEALAALLRQLAPDVVFVHHYVHLGVEILTELRLALPSARILLTLHDFVAICRNGGLMVKTGLRGPLCERAEPQACHNCFPGETPMAFVARRRALLAHLAAADGYIAPSRFLAARYMDWGLPARRIAVIENGLERRPAMASAVPAREGDGTLRLAVFGQLREAKGLDIALAALHRLTAGERAALHLEIHGGRLEAQEPWFQALVARLAEPLAAQGCVSFRGAYGRGEVAGRMAGVDAVIVPSVWWENSPLVIQEAFAAGVPVIGADLGGIREKLRDGIDGLLFEPRDPEALAGVLRRLLHDPALPARLASGVRAPRPLSAMVGAYLWVAALDFTPLPQAARA